MLWILFLTWSCVYEVVSPTRRGQVCTVLLCRCHILTVTVTVHVHVCMCHVLESVSLGSMSLWTATVEAMVSRSKQRYTGSQATSCTSKSTQLCLKFEVHIYDVVSLSVLCVTVQVSCFGSCITRSTSRWTRTVHLTKPTTHWTSKHTFQGSPLTRCECDCAGVMFWILYHSEYEPMDSYGGGYGQYVPASSTQMASSQEMVKDFGAPPLEQLSTLLYRCLE